MLVADLVRLAIAPIMVVGAILIWRSKRYIVGRLLILIGVLHLSGGWVARQALKRMVENGFIGQADSAVGMLPSYTNQELAFWFLLWGLMTAALGQVLIMLEQRGVLPPRWWGWQLLILNLICAALMPKGGFWWMLLPAWMIIRRNQHPHPHHDVARDR
jgi:hypothetical protein